MVFLCFVLDLCNLSPPLLKNLRQLKVAYSPRGNFNLLDFHNAINDVPTDSFLPEINDSGSLRSCDVKLSSILSDQVLYSWVGKDIMRKVIVLRSCVPDNVDSELKVILMSRVCHSLVKQWLQELKDDMKEPLQARFIFKSNLIGSVNHIFCSLSTSVCQITDGFGACQTCRCHGSMLDNRIKDKNVGASCPITRRDQGISDMIETSVQVGDKTILFLPSFQSSMKLKQLSSPIDFNIIEKKKNVGASCPITGRDQGISDMIETSVQVGDKTILFLPSFQSSMKLKQLSSPIDFNIIEKTNLSSLSEGICSVLHSMDQGRLCSSCCNVETMREAAFHCYYLLQPSDNGPMLLRDHVQNVDNDMAGADIGEFGANVGGDAEEELQNGGDAGQIQSGGDQNMEVDVEGDDEDDIGHIGDGDFICIHEAMGGGQLDFFARILKQDLPTFESFCFWVHAQWADRTSNIPHQQPNVSELWPGYNLDYYSTRGHQHEHLQAVASSEKDIESDI
ncbi:unnamed protein product [Dovyalis caffra]|uniref:Uncharacterized protein n=1 Tax=Dovyalis caffra TaxID=77055 RepID=A0AAV1RN75_9ROSI|nr:unnamed protein product [Dovyalis caffra]